MQVAGMVHHGFCQVTDGLLPLGDAVESSLRQDNCDQSNRKRQHDGCRLVLDRVLKSQAALFVLRRKPTSTKRPPLGFGPISGGTPSNYPVILNHDFDGEP